MNTPPALGSASHLIENYPDEFLITLVETWGINFSVEYPEGDTRDGFRSCIDSMESTIETGNVSDCDIVSNRRFYVTSRSANVVLARRSSQSTLTVDCLSSLAYHFEPI